jgi:flagellar hook-associated protein 2
MGTITSGIGLMSGLNINDIVSKLMTIERMPLTQLQSRIKNVDTQRTAIADLSARVLALKAAFAPLKNSLLFKSTKATSSNEDLIRATASSGAAAGTYRVRVEQLAASQQLVTRGVFDPDRSPLGAGTLVFASGLSKLAQQTSLDMLNGQQGISRGTIRITDGSGASAQVDLSGAKTVQDVVGAINSASGIQVQAEVRGDRLAIVDLSGAQTSVLSVADVGIGHTAQDLGIAGTGSVDELSGRVELVGADINRIVANTSLSLLNDGNGVGNSGGAGDMKVTAADGTIFSANFSDVMDLGTNLAMLNNGQGVRLGTIKITHSDNTTAEVDLTTARTMQDVVDLLQAKDVMVVVTGNKIQVTDNIKGSQKLIIADGTSGHAALDLGIAGSSAGANKPDLPETIRGSEIYRIRTVGDVLRAINYAAGNYDAASDTRKVTASLDAAGKGIVLTDNTGVAGQLTVAAINGSTAMRDLGLTGTAGGVELTGERLIATMNTTLLRSLNGGQGIQQLGTVSITDRAGKQTTFDFSGAKTVDDILSVFADQLQAGGAQVRAKLADSGLGIVIEDLSGGTGPMTIADVTGTTAQDLKIAGSTTTATLRSGTLTRQFISGSTLLSDMNYGKGIAAGSFTITDSAGRSTTISVSNPKTTRLQELLRQINSAADGSSQTTSEGQTTIKPHVEARINDTGDGIVIVDKAGGEGHLTITDGGGTAAHDLKIAGTAAAGEDSLDGRISRQISLGAGDSLNSLAAQLAQAGDLLSVGVINDGSSISPYRLMISATNSGTRGALAIDSGDVLLGLDTLVQAQDAVAYIGGDGKTGGIRVVSSENQLTSVIPNATLTLTGKVGDYADITVASDTGSLIKQLGSIAEKVSDVVSRIKALTSYDAETSSRGILLGDSAVYRLSDTMYRLFDQQVTVDGKRLRLSDLGLKITSSGASFDEAQFHKAFDSNPDVVQKAFTDATNGLWAKIDKIFTNLSDSGSGLLPSRSEALQKQTDLFNRRVTELSSLLDSKERRLYAQYQAMETALSRLQGQQAALASLASLVTSARASRS